ncbi:glycosyl transferase [Salmonella enterica]|nr:glycosyl transferase [Salmonella enterica]EEM7113331.1 glycosyl transferase [Salmonella enterica subsp. enterica serovar Poona]EAS9893651.1 glycosyl transferase [Salmonella enterica]EEG2848747.1 glycosyl transferase [Salmonella enterica]EEH1295212.1 glycosyl transferase [Salmonella enterica]
MTKISYHIKYLEYFFKKCSSFLTSDIYFHTVRLNKISNEHSNLRNPITLNEKICHRMVFDRNPLYTMLADKLAVREYVERCTGLVNLIPLISVYSRVEDINFENLPDRFVLKCNHDSGSAIICKNKEFFEKDKVMNRLKLSLKKNMYYTTREWQYKNILPVIICEMYLDLFADKDRNVTPEMLRIHCFHGVACFIEADFTDENSCDFINVYDSSWSLLPFQMEYPNTPTPIKEPVSFNKAVIAAQTLAKEIEYCRVDLMLKGEDIYFSEITLSPKRGKLKITPEIWNAKLGSMWDLSLANNRFN